jgi:hypothetical protein
MKNFGIMILCISLAVAAFLFALKGRYQVSTYEGSRVGLMPWMRYDTMTGRTWLVSDKGVHWIEVRDYGYAYNKPEEQESAAAAK